MDNVEEATLSASVGWSGRSETVGAPRSARCTHGYEEVTLSASCERLCVQRHAKGFAFSVSGLLHKILLAVDDVESTVQTLEAGGAAADDAAVDARASSVW